MIYQWDDEYKDIMPDEDYLVAEQATTSLSVIKENLTEGSFLAIWWT